MHFIHSWGKWSEPFMASNSSEVAQMCKCSICGRVKIRAVSRPWNWWFTDRVLTEAYKGSGEVT